MKTKLLMLGLVLTLLVGSVSALPFYRNPESPFYGMFKFTERLEELVALTNQRRLEVAIKHAERRTEELGSVTKDITFIKVQMELEEKVERANELCEKLGDEESKIRLQEQVREVNQKSLQVLEQVRARWQENSMIMDGIQNAIQTHQEIKAQVEERIRGGNN